MNEIFLSGVFSIAGPPNVGKSTLLNRLLGTKVAIVSPKPQTTRNRILGILHGEGYQMIFIDTPGIHRTRTALHRSMVDSARATFMEVDAVLLMIDINRPDDPDIPLILWSLKDLRKPAFLVINKIDTGPKERLLPVLDRYQREYPFEALVPVSALTGEGLDLLLRELKTKLEPGPRLFPEDVKTDQSEPFIVSEIIREKIYLLTSKELPYSSAVTVEEIAEIPGKKLLSVSAKIHVETESQKRILIGNKGRMIKDIGRLSRLELERIFGTRVFLDLFIRVEKNWSRDARALRRLGY